MNLKERGGWDIFSTVKKLTYSTIVSGALHKRNYVGCERRLWAGRGIAESAVATSVDEVISQSIFAKSQRASWSDCHHSGENLRKLTIDGFLHWDLLQG